MESGTHEELLAKAIPGEAEEEEEEEVEEEEEAEEAEKAAEAAAASRAAARLRAVGLDPGASPSTTRADGDDARVEVGDEDDADPFDLD